MSSINALMVQGGADNPTPIPVSGTVTSTPAVGSTWTVAGTVSAAQSGAWTVGGTVGVSGTVTVQPAGGATWTVAGTVTTVPSGTQTVAGTVSVGNTVTVTPAPATTWTTSVSNTVTVTPAPATTWTVAGTVAVSGTTTVQLTPTVTAGDALANPTAPQEISHVHEWNPANAQWQRGQCLSGGTILAAAARTAATTGTQQQNSRFSGLTLMMRITVGSGTGGITPKLQGFDEASGIYYDIWTASLSQKAVGVYTYTFGPSAGLPPGATSIIEAVIIVLPPKWRVNTAVGDASSITYSIGYSYGR